MAEPRSGGKSASAFRTISEVSGELGVPQHVLRFWESKFTQLRPLKRGGGRRYYRPEDIALLRRIQGLLYDDGYTIKGVQRLFREGRVQASAKQVKATEKVVEAVAAAPSSRGGSEAPSLGHEHLSEILSDLTEIRDTLRSTIKK